jgi:nucleoid-associated protein YgaU
MHDKTARVFAGLGVLVVIWIVVYWSWPVKDDGSSLGDLSLGELPAAVSVEGEDGASQGSGAERFPAPPVRRPVPGPVEEGDPPEEAEGVAAAPPAGVIPPEFRSYTVVSGDNFERISQKVYGSRRFGMAIARANPLLDPRRLREGMTIRVPVDPGNIQGVPADEDGEAAGDRTPPETPTIEYTVRRGDTLSSIAQAFYGSVRHVDFLFGANRDRLATKDDLRLGQVLLIPPLPEGAD